MSAVAILKAFPRFGQRPSDDALGIVADREDPARASTAPATTLDLEASMPRWRRPSLIKARRADIMRDPAPAPRLVFEVLPEGVAGKAERRLVRYAIAPLLDAPDEFRGRSIGDLEAGDEVVVVDGSGAYWLVDCPDGRRGSVHRMTLGGPVIPPGDLRS